jgi:prophage regulatory protein
MLFVPQTFIAVQTGANMATNLKILRRRQVQERVGLSRSTIYAKLNSKQPDNYDATFPKPVSLGAKAVGWIESEIDAWIATQIEKSRVPR